MSTPLRGLYAITSAELVAAGRDALCAAVASAIRGGATLIQFRDKRLDARQRRMLAGALRETCHAANARLLINDDVELARAIGADGVHLGRGDGDITAARRALGTQALIGASCHNDLELAQAALAAGADYVAFGRFFASTTKPEAPPAQLATLREARRRFAAPLCAIGGITPDNAPQVVAAGADLVAAIAGIFAADDIEAAARAYCSAIDDSRASIP